MGEKSAEREKKLDALFADLKDTKAEADIRLIIKEIWAIWMDSGRADVDELMIEGSNAMAAGKVDDALKAYNDVIEKMPEFAEGWNKRATVYFNLGDLESAKKDIEKTLSIEKRHFGALSGLISIYRAMNDKVSALKIFGELLDIYPHYPGLNKGINALYEELGMTRT